MAEYLVGGQLVAAVSWQVAGGRWEVAAAATHGRSQLPVGKLVRHYKITNVKINFINFQYSHREQNAEYFILDSKLDGTRTFIDFLFKLKKLCMLYLNVYGMNVSLEKQIKLAPAVKHCSLFHLGIISANIGSLLN